MTNQPILPVLTSLAGRRQPRPPQPGKFRRAGERPDPAWHFAAPFGLTIADVGSVILESKTELV